MLLTGVKIAQWEKTDRNRKQVSVFFFQVK